VGKRRAILATVNFSQEIGIRVSLVFSLKFGYSIIDRLKGSVMMNTILGWQCGRRCGQEKRG
jgi:hypothetical protein